MSMCRSSNGTRYGPNTVANTSSTMTTRPMIASRWRMKRRSARLRGWRDREGRGMTKAASDISVEPDARVGSGVKQIRHQVAEQHKHRGEHQHAHHHRVVTITDGI